MSSTDSPPANITSPQDDRRSRPMVQLVFSLFLLRLGGTMTTVALPLFVIERYGFGVGVGIALAARLLPNVLLGFVVGYFVDRFEPRTVAFLTAVANAAILTMIPLTSSLLQVQVLAFLTGIAYMFGFPSRMALRPLVMSKGSEVRGNAMLVTAERLSSVVGPLAAGGVIAFRDVESIFWLQAVTATVAGLLMLGLPKRGETMDDEFKAAESVRGALRDIFVLGPRTLFNVVRADAMLRAVTLTAFTYVAAVSIGEILIVKIALENFQSIDGATGFLLAAMGAGGVLGALVAARFSGLHQGRLYFFGNVLEGVAWLILPFMTLMGGAVALMFLAGFLESLATVVYFAEVQKRLPVRLTGRFYAIFVPLTDAFMMAGALLGVVIIGQGGLLAAAVTIMVCISVPVLTFARTLLASDVSVGIDEHVVQETS